MAAKSAYTAADNNASRISRNINEPSYYGTSRSVKLPIERHDLSPVSKFREEQKGALYNSNLPTAYSSIKATPTNGHHKYSSFSSASRQDNTIPVYSSSLLYSELAERNPSLRNAYKSKPNPIKNIENQTTNSSYPSSKYERFTGETASSSRSGTRFNSTYKVIKYSDIDDDKLY
jgi:hypothetical protein